MRRKFGLSAQQAIRVIGKVADAYAALRANTFAGNYGPPGSPRRTRVQDKPIRFRTGGTAIRRPMLVLADSRRRRYTRGGCVHPVGARPVAQCPRHCRTAGSGAVAEQPDRGDRLDPSGWFLYASVEAAEAPLAEPVNGFVGVDMGIVNIATTSTGRRASGARLNRYRKRQGRLRKRLQAKKTSSARRLLRRRRRKEARFAADLNHQISKCIVAEAERTRCGIAVEQLTGIRDRVRLRKPQRATLHSWAFAQLGSFLAYKAKQAGVAFVEVDPAYTSQMCSACGWVDKKNRRSQAAFECGRCRFVGHADHNAAVNIASRGVERWGEVMRPSAAPTLTASQGGSSRPIGTRSGK